MNALFAVQRRELFFVDKVRLGWRKSSVGGR